MSIAEKIADAFEVSLPADVVAFLDSDPQDRILHLEKGGMLRGTFACDFSAHELASIEELCELQWIDEGDTLAAEWKDSYGSLVPLALLGPAGSEEGDDEKGEEPVKSFLAVDAGGEGAPVFLWDYDGWKCYLVAATFADFVAGKAPAESVDARSMSTSIADRDRIGNSKYTAFSWKKA